jgi:hypothetical protein
VGAEGASLGAPAAASVGGASIGPLDLASTGDHGAVVFEERVTLARSEIHLRPLDADGAPTGDVRHVSGAVDPGASPSVAPLLGGYLVAYRAQPLGGRPVLRVDLVDRDGAPITRVDLEALEGPGDVLVRVGPDGVAYLLWESGPRVVDVEGSPVNALVVRGASVRCD